MSGFFGTVAGYGSDIGKKILGAFTGGGHEAPKEVDFSVRIKQLIEGCTYPKTNKSDIEKAAQMVYNQYKLECGIISFTESGQLVHYLELSGSIPVDYKGRTFPVLVKLFLPKGYPDQTPLIRIVNTHPENSIVVDEYRQFQSPVDHNSYVLSKLPSVQNWNKYSDLRSIIREAQQLMVSKFPFRTVIKETHEEPSPPIPKPAQNPTQKQFPSGPGIGGSTQKGGFMHPVAPRPPIPLPHPPAGNAACKKLVINLLDNCIPFRESTQKQADTLQANHNSSYDKIQRMSIIGKCLTEQVEILGSHSNELKRFLIESESAGEVQLKSVVGPADPVSKELLEYSASKRALEDVIIAIESRFRDGLIDLDTFIKLIRRYEEQKFVTKEMIRRLERCF